MLGCSVAQVMISNSFFTLLFDRWLRRALDILESEPQESLELARTCPQMSCRFPLSIFLIDMFAPFLVELPSLSKESYKSF